MSFVDTWDTGLPGAVWDSGLQWDVNTGPNPGDPSPYVALITSEHNQRLKFMTMVTSIAQVMADIIVLIQSIPGKFDFDTAEGAELDVLGLWIGASRNVAVPLSNVYFSLDTAGLGFDQGTWWSTGDSVTQLVTLPDDAYRTLLRARIANNTWDGTIPGAYAAWDLLFAGTGVDVLIQDYQNMHMAFALTGTPPDAVTLALFTGGYLNLRPAGVRIDGYITPSIVGGPYFGFDIENGEISGFDVGAFGLITPAP